MIDQRDGTGGLSRRGVLAGGSALALSAAVAPARAQTGLDMEAARREGKVVIYNNWQPNGIEPLLQKFREANPKVYRAVLDALREATAAINADKRRAAEMYVKEGGGKESVDQILKMMSDPQVEYTLAPQRLLPYAQFMNKVGTLKNNPASWKDLFFPDIHDLPGS